MAFNSQLMPSKRPTLTSKSPWTKFRPISTTPGSTQRSVLAQARMSCGRVRAQRSMWKAARCGPLDEFIEQDGLNLGAYNQTIAELYNLGGNQYGVPKDFDAWVVIYNATVFEELAVTPPSPGWTWDDMVRIAHEIDAAQTGATDIPLYYNYDWNNGVSSLIHSLGGMIVENEQGAVPMEIGVEALEMVRGLQEEGLIFPVADSGDLNPVNGLVSGTIAMSVIPSWNLSLLSGADVPPGTFHAVHLPAVNGNWFTDTNGLSYVMGANTRNPEEAWDLIRFLTSDQGALLHAQGGAGPSRQFGKGASGGICRRQRGDNRSGGCARGTAIIFADVYGVSSLNSRYPTDHHLGHAQVLCG